MSGPRSIPVAKTSDGRLVIGKTALHRAGLASRQNMRDIDWRLVRSEPNWVRRLDELTPTV